MLICLKSVKPFSELEKWAKKMSETAEGEEEEEEEGDDQRLSK